MEGHLKTMPHTICRMQITKDTQSFQFNDVYESIVYTGQTLETKIITDDQPTKVWYTQTMEYYISTRSPTM